VISARKACEALDEVTQPSFSKDGQLGWLERSAFTNGKTQLLIETSVGIKLAIPESVSVASRINEYGGRAWCWADNKLVYVNAKDQQLYITSENQRPIALTQELNKRFAEPIYAPALNAILAICETHTQNTVRHSIVLCTLGDKGLVELDTRHDFYAGLSLNPLLNELAWVSWNHPDMPWTSTHLETATITPTGLINRSVVAGQFYKESLTQPRFDPHGNLWVVSDRSGYWNLFRVEPANNQLVNMTNLTSDCVSSPWQGGLVQYLPDIKTGTIHLQFSSDRISLVCPFNLELPPDINHIREISSFNSRLVVVAASPRVGTHLLEINLTTQTTTRLRPLNLESSPALPPRLISYKVGTDLVSGYYYPPDTLNNTPPPLLMNLHGGPTSSAYPIYSPLVEYWTTRGFAFFDLNYRGSSNLGREYRFKLKGNWGVSEVEDIRAALDALIHKGLASPVNTFIRGRSSGGFSALMALCEGVKFKAAVSYFGVTDPLGLRSKTHKFESHYIDWLIGDPDKNKEGYTQRSPISRAHQIRCPVLFLQGKLDKIVTPDQTEQMHNELLKGGVASELKLFEHEGHGFKDIEVQVLSLELEYDFYRRYLF